MRGAKHVALAIAVALAACGGAASAPTALQGSASTPPPSTPAPSLVWIDNGFDTTGLPAIAADGSRVVYALRAEDGGRGNPNLALVVVDRTDRELRRHAVLTVDEVDAMFDERGPTAALRGRIAEANRTLADLHAAHDLRPLAMLAGGGHALSTERTSIARGEGLEVTWDTSRLEIRRRRDIVVDVATPASWLVQDRPLCASCAETCSNPAYLASVHADAARALVLLEVAYAGTDTCWEPTPQHHVVSW